jgi:ligand-binding SRPBCC domain-containing protein
MKFHHRFVVEASLGEVAAFHQKSGSMKAITPPPIIVRIHSAPDELADGDEMAFTLWMGPLPFRWRARIENVTENGFTDRQLSGPFADWVHEHRFVSESENRTAVIDTVEAKLSKDWLKRIAGLSMWFGMPVLFAYRGWKTRKILNSRHARSSHDTVSTARLNQ